VVIGNQGMIKEKLSGTYNEHLKGLILEPLDGKEIVVIESDAYCPYCVNKYTIWFVFEDIVLFAKTTFSPFVKSNVKGFRVA
jgi:hypothetical protein